MRILIALASLGALLSLLASPAPAFELRPDVHKHVLDNGLTLLMVERHQAPVISSVILYKVGGADEPSGATGIAHLFEHMAFKGTRKVGVTHPRKEAALFRRMDRLIDRQAALKRRSDADPEQLAELDAQIKQLQDEARELVIPNQFGDLYLRQGATGLNASTGADNTTYYVNFPANRLPFWAAIESDRMANTVLREFYSEREVVIEERRMRTDNSPRGRLYEAFLSTAFHAHPYGNPVIGWRSDLERITRPQAQAFFDKYYVPENTIIALVGDLDPDATLELVKKSFGRLPGRPAPPPPHTVEPPITGERRIAVHYDASPSMMMGWQRPAITHPDDIVFDVIKIILSNGASSRLYKRLVLDDKLATSVNAGSGTPGSRFPHLFTVSATPRHPHTVAEVETALLEELARLQTDPVTERELAKAVNTVEAGLVRSLRSNGGMARSLAFFEASAGDWQALFDLHERIARVTPEDVVRVAKTYLDPTRRVVAELIKTEPETDENKEDAP